MDRYSINPVIEKVIKTMQRDNGDFPTHEQIVRHLERNFPEAVDKYLTSHRTSLLGGAVTRQMQLQRNSLRHTQLANRLKDGTTSAVFDLKEFWSTPFHVPGGIKWKQLGDLTGADHTLIADRYEFAAVAVTARAELHRNLADVVGISTTKEVYDPKRLMREIDYAYDTTRQLPGGTK